MNQTNSFCHLVACFWITNVICYVRNSESPYDLENKSQITIYNFLVLISVLRLWISFFCKQLYCGQMQISLCVVGISLIYLEKKTLRTVLHSAYFRIVQNINYFPDKNVSDTKINSHMTTIKIVNMQRRSADLTRLPVIAQPPRTDKASVIVAVNNCCYSWIPHKNRLFAGFISVLTWILSVLYIEKMQKSPSFYWNRRRRENWARRNNLFRLSVVFTLPKVALKLIRLRNNQNCKLLYFAHSTIICISTWTW